MRTALHASAGSWPRWILTAFVVLTCLKVWLGPINEPTAVAQIPDAGTQRLQTIKVQEQTNQLLSQILRTLQTETLNVRVHGADKTAQGAKAPRAERP